jgi:transposase InsO family protein
MSPARFLCATVDDMAANPSSTPSSGASYGSTTLETSAQYTAWLQSVRTVAESFDAWPMIDPALDTQVVRQRPACPTMPSATAPDLALQLALYTAQQAAYDRYLQTERDLMAFLRSAIHPDILRSIPITARSPHAILRHLAANFAPSDDAQEEQISSRFTALLLETPPSAPPQAVRVWINKWRTLHQDASPALQSVIRVNFLQRARAVNRVWHQCEAKLARPFSEHVDSLLLAVEQDAASEAFAQPVLAARSTLNFAKDASKSSVNKSNEPSESGKQVDSKRRNWSDLSAECKFKCVCGDKHYYCRCPYIVTAVRPDNWTPDDTIAARILTARESKEVARRLDSAVRWAKENPEFCAKLKAKRNAEAASRQHAPSSLSTTARRPILTLGVYNRPSPDTVIVDSGAHHHVCNNMNRFVPGTFDPTFSTDIQLADGQTLRACGRGMMLVVPDVPYECAEFECSDAIFLPQAPCNLVSMAAAKERGVNIDCYNGVIRIGDMKLCGITLRDRDFVIELGKAPRVLSAATPQLDVTPPIRDFAAGIDTVCPKATKATIDLWHRRLGHLHAAALRRLDSSVHGIILNSSGPVDRCEPCMLAKSHQLIARAPQARAARAFQKIHLDFTIMDTAADGSSVLLHLTDDATRMHFVYACGQRAGALLDVCRAFLSYVYTQWEARVKVIRMDNDASLSRAFRMMLQEHGIVLELTAPYTPAQNGVAERAGGVIIQAARTMRIAASLPANLWPEITEAACYILNRSRPAANGKTAYEQVYGCQPHVGHLRAYGSKAFVLQKPAPPRSAKLAPRAFVGYLIGYEGTNIYKVWVPGPTHKVVRVRDVVFDENAFYTPDSEPNAIPQEIIIPEPPRSELMLLSPLLQALQQTEHQPRSPFAKAGARTCSPTPDKTSPGGFSDDDDSDTDSLSTIRVDAPPPVTVLAPRDLSQDQSWEGPTLPASAVQSVEASPPVPRAAPRASEVSATISTANIISDKRTRSSRALAIYSTPSPPSSYAVAQKHPHAAAWNEAITAELNALRQQHTFDEETACAQHEVLTALPSKWVFTYKHNADGEVLKHKARLVIRGDMELNPDDVSTYAATPPAALFRFLIAHAVRMRWPRVQFDISNAFLNATMESGRVFIKRPEGWPEVGSPPAFRLRRAMYGLQRSPNLWYRLLASVIQSMGFSEGPDNCLWIHADRTLLLHYVDDVLMIGPSQHALRMHLAAFQGKFQLREQPGNQFLGVSITTCGEHVHLNQSAYITRILDKYGIDASQVNDPFPYNASVADCILPAGDEPDKSLVRRMQQKIGSINYAATMTRPDIAKSVNKLATVMLRPNAYAEQLTDRLLSYLGTTRKHGLLFSRDPPIDFGPGAAEYADRAVTAFSDASYCDLPNCHSSTGYVFIMANAAIDWSAKRLMAVAHDTSEAELAAASQAGTRTLWWKRVLTTCDVSAVIPLLVDNAQTVRALQMPEHAFKTRVKHIDIKHHWLRQHTVHDAAIPVRTVRTKLQAADFLTKSLHPQAHAASMRLVGVSACCPRSCGGVSATSPTGNTATQTSGAVRLDIGASAVGTNWLPS